MTKSRKDSALTPIERIIQRIKALGISKREAARRSGLAENILAGQTKGLTADTIAAFAKGLGVTVAELYGEAAPAAAPTTAAAGFQLLTHKQIAPGGFNPRTIFDDAALAELKASIVAHGLIEPLVARPAAKGTGFELVAGERRWRAIGLAIKAGELAADYPIPVSVRPCDDIGALELAITENVMRENMHPLEEGEAFAKLVDAGRDTAAIAATMNRTRRWVQARIQLARNLCPEAKKKFLDGNMRLAAAEALARAPMAAQKPVVRYISPNTDERDVTRELSRGGMDANVAIFDRAAYKGAVLTDDDGKVTAYLDGREAAALQRDAIAAKVADLKTKWAFVEIYDAAKSEYAAPWNYGRSKDRKIAGAIVEISHSLKVTIETGRTKLKTGGKGKGTKGGKGNDGEAQTAPVEPLTQAHARWAAMARTEALQTALAADAHAAKAVLILSLIPGRAGSPDQGATQINGRDYYGNFLATHGPLDARLGELLRDEIQAGLTRTRLETDSIGIELERKPGAYADLLARFMARTPAELDAILAILVARRTGDWPTHKPAAGGSAPALAIAAAVKADAAGGFDMTMDYLAGFNRVGLERIARACLPGVDEKTWPKKASDFRDFILTNMFRDKAWRPPELEFADRPAMLTALGADPRLTAEAAQREAERAEFADSFDDDDEADEDEADDDANADAEFDEAA